MLRVTLPHLCHALEGVVIPSRIANTGSMVSTLVRVSVIMHASAGMDEQVGHKAEVVHGCVHRACVRMPACVLLRMVISTK